MSVDDLVLRGTLKMHLEGATDIEGTENGTMTEKKAIVSLGDSEQALGPVREAEVDEAVIADRPDEEVRAGPENETGEEGIEGARIPLVATGTEVGKGGDDVDIARLLIVEAETPEVGAQACRM